MLEENSPKKEVNKAPTHPDRLPQQEPPPVEPKPILIGNSGQPEGRRDGCVVHYLNK